MEINSIENNQENKYLEQEQTCLREHVLEAIDGYFRKVQETPIHQRQSDIVNEVEAAMYEGIMRYTKGNQSKAAKVLGVSRGTLRTKLMHYFSTTHVGGVYRV